MILGFTGTRHGMTDAQKATVERVVRDVVTLTVVHHGDCVGADADFHAIVRDVAPHVFIVVHPPTDRVLRAFCEGDSVRSAKGYMRRNADIVAEAEAMIATPYEDTMRPDGGTWRTVRIARGAGRPVTIVWPDGHVENR